jgi:GNAT superfamily N-acetyltransferase
MQEQLHRALTFLSCDVLKNIVLLKMLHAYPNAIRCYYTESPAAAGVLLLLPTQASAFDSQTYPASKFVVFLSTTDPAAAQALLLHIPRDCNLVFKLMDARDQAAVEHQFPLRRITSYLSYTSPAGSDFPRSPHISVADTIDPRCLNLYAEQGHSPKEVQEYFTSEQALSFALYQGHIPISVCFAYRNFGEVWEIGGVYTMESKRRQGYARQVVETALHVLLRYNRIPRYQVHESNRPSIHLAENLGLRRFVTMEHFGYGI